MWAARFLYIHFVFFLLLSPVLCIKSFLRLRQNAGYSSPSSASPAPGVVISPRVVASVAASNTGKPTDCHDTDLNVGRNSKSDANRLVLYLEFSENDSE